MTEPMPSKQLHPFASFLQSLCCIVHSAQKAVGSSSSTPFTPTAAAPAEPPATGGDGEDVGGAEGASRADGEEEETGAEAEEGEGQGAMTDEAPEGATKGSGSAATFSTFVVGG